MPMEVSKSSNLHVCELRLWIRISVIRQVQFNKILSSSDNEWLTKDVLQIKICMFQFKYILL